MRDWGWGTRGVGSLCKHARAPWLLRTLRWFHREGGGGCSSYPIPSSSVPLFGVCSTSTPDEQGHPLTEQAWPTRTRRQPLDGAAQGSVMLSLSPSPVQVGRGICLKRHQFQSVDTKFETACGSCRKVCVSVCRAAHPVPGEWDTYRLGVWLARLSKPVCNPGPCASPDPILGACWAWQL